MYVNKCDSQSGQFVISFNFAYWVILHAFLSSADCFFNYFFFQNFLLGIPSVSNSLAPDQARQHVGPDLGQNCVQFISRGQNLPLLGRVNMKETCEKCLDVSFVEYIIWVYTAC